MKTKLLIPLLFLSVNLFSQVTQKIPNHRLPEYNSKKVVLSAGINPWWYISLKTDLVGNRIQGGFARADNDTLLYLHDIMSKQFMRTELADDIKILNDGFEIDNTSPLILHFSNGKTIKIPPYKELSSSVLWGGPITAKASIDIHLFYIINSETLSLFQNYDLEKMDVQLVFRGEVEKIEYSIENKPKKMIKKLANSIHKIKIK